MSARTSSAAIPEHWSCRINRPLEETRLLASSRFVIVPSSIFLEASFCNSNSVKNHLSLSNDHFDAKSKGFKESVVARFASSSCYRVYP